MAYMRKFDLTTEDGDEIFTGNITGGLAGTIVTSMALDSQGNHITLPEGALFVMVSPEQSADVWNEASAVMAGPILRIMAVKSGIPSNVSSLSITAISADVFPTSVGAVTVSGGTVSISGTVPVTGSVEVSGSVSADVTNTVNVATQSPLSVSVSEMLRSMTYREAATLQGLVFNASRRVVNVAAGAFLDTRFRTGNVATILLARNIGYTGNGVAASIYRNATYTGTGTDAEVNNPNDVAPATVQATVQTGITFASGTLTTAIAYSEGNASNQGKGAAQASLGEPVVMLPNTEYVLRIQSLDTAAQNVTAYLAWIEGNVS